MNKDDTRGRTHLLTNRKYVLKYAIHTTGSLGELETNWNKKSPAASKSHEDAESGRLCVLGNTPRRNTCLL
jgi:hypothetical protein